MYINCDSLISYGNSSQKRSPRIPWNKSHCDTECRGVMRFGTCIAPFKARKKNRNSHIDRSAIGHSPLLDTSKHVLSNTSYPRANTPGSLVFQSPKPAAPCGGGLLLNPHSVAQLHTGCNSDGNQFLRDPHSELRDLVTPKPASRFLWIFDDLCIPAYPNSVCLLRIPINLQVHCQPHFNISYISYIDKESVVD